MKDKVPSLVCSFAVILMLVLAGCVAPPTENASTPLNLYDPNQFANNTSTTQSSSVFVTEVPLSDYTVTTTTPKGFTTFVPATQIPADITCRIHSVNLTGFNGSAFLFNLKNPPMYIHYSVIPTNVTVNRVYTDSFTKKTTTYTYSDYSPQSWFEVTVRDNATKAIILQDGFGGKKGYTTYLSRTLKVMENKDLLVEFRASDIQASVTMWVKPIGNFDESRLSEFTDCTYWDSTRASLVTAKQTTIEGAIYTWTIENQATSQSSAMKQQGQQVPQNISNIDW